MNFLKKNNLNIKFIFLIILFPKLLFCQIKSFTGIISNTNQNPLESANIIAKPLQENASLKFAIADNKGLHRLELENNVKYEI